MMPAGVRPPAGVPGEAARSSHGRSTGLRGNWGRRNQAPSGLPAPQPMSDAPFPDRFSAAGEYSRHRRKAMALLARRFPRLQEDERLELYHAVWASVLEKRRRGERIENVEAFLIGRIHNLALKRLGR